MDISKITDIDKLKSLAYDQMATLEQAQSNLRAISQRIEEVQQDQNKVSIQAEAKKS